MQGLGLPPDAFSGRSVFGVFILARRLDMEGLLSLLKSRKFWLAIFGVVQVLVFHFLNVPDEIWQAIAALVAVLISAIAVEDAAEKRAGELYQADEENAEPEA